MTEHRNQLEDREYDVLMAAAPDLLAACDALAALYNNFGLVLNELDADDAQLQTALEAMHAAIAKARGEVTP